MDSHTAQRLKDLNQQFYQTFAAPFSATRARVNPGVARVLERLPLECTILDLGCGNGSVAAALIEGGFAGEYTGLDFSGPLLADAHTAAPGFHFKQADLTGTDWPALLGERRFDAIFSFATLHHIPGEELRLSFLKQVHGLLAPGGRFTHSNWQFLNSDKLKERVQPWERAGLSEADVDAGDYLLDWRGEGEGLRYVHHFNEDELATLAWQTSFSVLESFTSDGHTGDLGLYQVWGIND